MRLIITGLLLILAVTTTQAAYITDKLVAGLYKEAKVTDKPVKALTSGTPLEVVSRKNGFIKVRTSDGVIGWVESTYLTDEKPARSILLDTQAKLSILQKKLDKLSRLEKNADAAKAVDEIAALQEKLAQAQGKISQLEIQLKALRISGDQLDESRDLLEREKKQLVADMQKQNKVASKALEKENALLKKQINQVREILKVPVSNAITKPQKVEVVDSAVNQTDKPLLDKFTASVSGKPLWMIAIALLLLGFVAGYYVMRIRVQHRFGPMFRL
ncbi:MAG: TIGR04211 family SH3 domain-containing protein [Gammaproteobacteria bacterium]|nr:TIGR04211 family SH3 domain-containing protein [Gammaproteobacteria bacterium]